MEVSWILVGVVTLLSFFVVKLWGTLKTSLPLWATIGLQMLAKYAVKYAEAKYGSGEGEAKFEFAFNWIEERLVEFDVFLQKFGLDINPDEITAAIKAAWYDLNIGQIQAGVKEIAPTQEA